MSTPKTIQEELKAFIAGLPNWQKFLLQHIITPDGQDLNVQNKALEYLLIESSLKEGKALEAITIPDLIGITQQLSRNSDFRLAEMGDIKNLNALQANQKITFGRNITVIYGHNGTGKSGFTRLMNNVFYSRGDKGMLPNIFSPKTNESPSAKFSFQNSQGVVQELHFPIDKNNQIFQRFAVFDNKSVQVHLSSGNELYVLPNQLSQLSKLATLVTTVAGLLDIEINNRKLENKFSKSFDGDSIIKTALDGLSSKTDLEKVKTLSELSAQEQSKIADLDIEVAKLKALNADTKKRELSNIKGDLKSLKSNYEKALSLVTKIKIEEYRTNLSNYLDLKEKAKQLGVNEFADSKFSGIGSEIWKSFIQSAKSYAELQIDNYPKEQDYCLLCKQSLTNEALDLFEKYWAFLSGEVEKKLRVAEQIIETSYTNFLNLTVKIPENESSLVKWLSENNDDLGKKILSCGKSLSSVCNSLKEAIKDRSSIAETLSLQFDLDQLNTLDIQIDDQINDLNTETIKVRLETITKELTTLQHRKKLKDIYNEVEAFVNNEKWLTTAREVRKKVVTTSITNLQKRLHEELLDKRYRQKFHQECLLLKAPYQIELEQKGTTGKTKRQLSVVGFQPSQVLSEGEQKSIALADFLTEVEISGIASGLIFDDPVTSLDHERKELIAKRLVAASESRQVIIFTHDLSFLYELKNECKKMNKEFTCHWVEKIGDNTGVVSLGSSPNLEKDHLSVAKAEEKLNEAKTVANAQERESLVREGMSKLRTCYEAFVITSLFNSVVTRFDRRIKYDQLKGVHVAKEHIDTICEKLGYLSGFIDGHLPSDLYSGTSPTTDLLENEIKFFKDFGQKYTLQKKEAFFERI